MECRKVSDHRTHNKSAVWALLSEHYNFLVFSLKWNLFVSLNKAAYEKLAPVLHMTNLSGVDDWRQSKLFCIREYLNSNWVNEFKESLIHARLRLSSMFGTLESSKVFLQMKWLITLTSAPLSKRSFPASSAISAFTITRPFWFLSRTENTVVPAPLTSDVNKWIVVNKEKKDSRNSCELGTDWKNPISSNELLCSSWPNSFYDNRAATVLHAFNALCLFS